MCKFTSMDMNQKIVCLIDTVETMILMFGDPTMETVKTVTTTTTFVVIKTIKKTTTKKDIARTTTMEMVTPSVIIVATIRVTTNKTVIIVGLLIIQDIATVFMIKELNLQELPSRVCY